MEQWNSGTVEMTEVMFDKYYCSNIEGMFMMIVERITVNRKRCQKALTLAVFHHDFGKPFSIFSQSIQNSNVFSFFLCVSPKIGV